MFYHLLYPLKSYISGLNIFQYITFRTAGAAITALLISFIIGPRLIALLKRYNIGEEIRTDGPQTHLSKQGTPTMGGLIVIVAVIVPTLLWADLLNTYTLIILGSTLWMGLLGFLDDWLKNVKKSPKGLIARYKLLGQTILGIAVGGLIFFLPEFSQVNSITTVPFFKNLEIDFGWFYIPMVVLVVIAASNAVNLTDGLDGLATGLLGISAMGFAVVSYISGRIDFSDYLNIMYLPGAGELTVYCGAFLGAALGFLWFNTKPAQVFMGDTGALSMGGALAIIAVLLKKELLLPIIGGMFVIETMSVIVQMLWFRYTKRKYGEGRRFFLMAPLHHHFELKGWEENQVVVRFWIIGILFALLTLSTFKIR